MRCGRKWKRPPGELRFEEAARLRDEIHLLETLDQRGKLEKHVQPEVFPIDPKKGWPACRRYSISTSRRGRSKASTSPTWPARKPWPALVRFIDGLPFKPGYRRLRIRRRRRAWMTLPASTKSYRGASSDSRTREDDSSPTSCSIDGGKGQLHAALAAFATLGHRPPTVISLAKREEEVYVPDATNRCGLAATLTPCDCCNTSAMRPIVLRSIIIISCESDRHWERNERAQFGTSPTRLERDLMPEPT